MSQVIVVIGGGAAGYFGAIRAAEKAKELGKNFKIIILEASSHTLKKVRISGGGRCNVTHNCFDVRQFCQNYPRGSKELISPMQRFQAKDTVQWFCQRGVPIVAEPDGRMFPKSNSSETIIDCFNRQIEKFKIQLKTNHAVTSVKKNKDGLFLIEIKNKESILASKVLLATGSSPRGYQLAADLGHRITERAPSLFSFKMSSSLLAGLEGLSFSKSRIKLGLPGKKIFRQEGPCLVTHWGLSGPAILKLSAWAAREMLACGYKAQLSVNWLGLASIEDAKKVLSQSRDSNQKSLLKNAGPESLQKRFWQSLIEFSGVEPERRWAELSKKDFLKLVENLVNTKFDILGKNRFKDEFVECGGVDLKELDFKSMESRVSPGLYVAGELLDVDGITGGFNFQNAWTTSWIAGAHMTDVL